MYPSYDVMFDYYGNNEFVSALREREYSVVPVFKHFCSLPVAISAPFALMSQYLIW